MIAVLGLVAGCTSRTRGPPAETRPDGEAPSAATQLERLLEEADKLVEVLTTVDPTDLESGKANFFETMTSTGTGSEGETLSSAATEFDRENGEAEVLAAVKVVVTQPTAEPSELVRRMRLTLVRTDQGWKAGDLERP